MAMVLPTSRHRLLARVLAAASACAAMLAATAPAVLAGGPYPDGARGYDISWPQCGKSYPPNGTPLSVVGVDDGHPFNSYSGTLSFNPNPCLASEWGWAQTAPYRPSVYLNTDYPHGNNAGYSPYAYGWDSASAGVSYAQSHGVSPAIWWLDVETTNWWQCTTSSTGTTTCDTAGDAQVIQGNLDFLHSHGLVAGVYSTPYQWQKLVGGYAPGVPNWTADYNDGDPEQGCLGAHAFGGGAVWQVQSAPGQFDPDYSCPSQHGYYFVAGDGGIFPYGDAVGYGSTGGMRLNKPIVNMAVTVSGHGYWLVASDGGIFPFGDAVGYGSTGGIRLNQPIVGMAATASGRGYWLVARDGGIFPFGDAGGYGSTGGIHLNQPIVGMARTLDGNGYWLVAADGGIFPFGDAPGYGSGASDHLDSRVVSMTVTQSGHGYLLATAGGGVYPFGDAVSQVYGSLVGVRLNAPVLSLAMTP